MTRAPILLALAVSAACGGRGRPTAPPIAHVAAPVAFTPAPAFAGIFHAGRRWSFDVTSREEHWDDQDPAAVNGGTVKTESHGPGACWVVEVRPLAGALASEIECDLDNGSSGTDPMTGVWIATASGLYRVDAMPAADTVPALERRALILPSPPVERTKQTTTPASTRSPESYFSETVSGSAGGWCHQVSYTSGDDGWNSVCIDAAGFVSGNYGWAGGSSHETELVRTR